MTGCASASSAAPSPRSSATAARPADLVLGALGGRTADEALAAGVDAGAVWLALCEAGDVPPARRHGVGLAEPPRR